MYLHVSSLYVSVFICTYICVSVSVYTYICVHKPYTLHPQPLSLNPKPYTLHPAYILWVFRWTAISPILCGWSGSWRCPTTVFAFSRSKAFVKKWYTLQLQKTNTFTLQRHIIGCIPRPVRYTRIEFNWQCCLIARTHGACRRPRRVFVHVCVYVCVCVCKRECVIVCACKRVCVRAYV